MTASEAKILIKVREYLGNDFVGPRYDFWFTYGKNGHAIGFEGGFELNQNLNFRNEYSIMPDRTLVCNLMTAD